MDDRERITEKRLFVLSSKLSRIKGKKHNNECGGMDGCDVRREELMASYLSPYLPSLSASKIHPQIVCRAGNSSSSSLSSSSSSLLHERFLRADPRVSQTARGFHTLGVGRRGNTPHEPGEIVPVIGEVGNRGWSQRGHYFFALK